MDLLKIFFTWLLLLSSSMNYLAEKGKEISPHPPVDGTEETEELAA